MPRKNNTARTLTPDNQPYNQTIFEKSSAAAAASVDILDSEMATAVGFTPTSDQFINDFQVVRVAHTTPGDEAAATIAIASVLRNGGNNGWTVTFTAAAAATKIVRVRVVRNG